MIEPNQCESVTFKQLLTKNNRRDVFVIDILGRPVSTSRFLMAIRCGKRKATQQMQVADYQTELSALKQEMVASQSTLSATVWQQYEQRLTALRLKHFP